MVRKNDKWKSLVNDAKDYDQTVEAILAFAALILFDGEIRRPGSQFGIGRRMSTSATNPVRPKADITPDLVAQKSISYGIVAEVKKSLDRDESHWTDHLTRLLKYDDKLSGWWTPTDNIQHSDSIMLIHQSRGRRFVVFLEAQKQKDSSLVGPNTCVVEFNQSGETDNYYFFRLEYGTLTEKELIETLRFGTPVPLDKVLRSFPNIRYYDSRPPIVMLLTHLWLDYFPSMLSEAKYDEKTKTKQMRISIQESVDELRKAYGSGALHRDARSAEFPRQDWIRDAFMRLAKYKLALPVTDNNDEFIILYRSFKDDVSEHFAKLEAKTSTEKPHRKGVQLPLFIKEL
jgi:hypothetical protein